MNISFNTIFWDDGLDNSDRIKSARFTSVKLIELCEHLKQNGVECVYNFYDFSPTKIIDNSIHIPFPLGEFRKSEKLNLIIKEQSTSEFICVVDSDCFFHKSDFSNFLETIHKLNEYDIITFDAAKLDKTSSELIMIDDENLNTIEFSYAYSGDKHQGPLSGGRRGGFGGIFICKTKLLIDFGGFNEDYKTWGGEDGELLDRILQSYNHNKLLPIRNYSPFHLHHFSDWGNPKYKS